MGVQFSRSAGQRIIRGIRTIEGIAAGQHTAPPRNPRRPRRGSGGGSRLVRFVMTSDWSSGAAGADFSEMDSAAFIAADTLRDPVSIFTDLEEGSQGLALLQSGKYWAIQAACPNEE